MKKILVFLLLAAVTFFIFASPLWAFDSESGEKVNISTSFSDDLYVFGSDVLVSEDIQGDLIAAGGRIEVKGDVSQDLMAAGGMVALDGDVGDDVRTSGGIISISGNIADDLIAAGGQITVSGSATIGGDLVISGGTLKIDGIARGNALLTGTNITISGKIDGDVEIGDVEKLVITSSAEITGDLVYRSAMRADISDEAKIGGEIKETIVREAREVKITNATPWAIFIATYIGGRVIAFLGLFVLGILLILAVPKLFERFVDRMKKTPGYCVGAGAIALFGVPIGAVIVFIISIILFITIIGSGVGLVAMASNVIILVLYGLLIYVSTVFLSYLLGRVIFSKTSLNMDKYGWKVLVYLIGLVIIMIVYSIPLVGWLIRFAGILFGLGGMVIVFKDLVSGNKK